MFTHLIKQMRNLPCQLSKGKFCIACLCFLCDRILTNFRITSNHSRELSLSRFLFVVHSKYLLLTFQIRQQITFEFQAKHGLSIHLVRHFYQFVVNLLVARRRETMAIRLSHCLKLAFKPQKNPINYLRLLLSHLLFKEQALNWC